jgi:hypothetical protein
MTVTRHDVLRRPEVVAELERLRAEAAHAAGESARPEEYWCCGAWRTKRAWAEHALADLNLGSGHGSVDLPPDGRSCVR